MKKQLNLLTTTLLCLTACTSQSFNQAPRALPGPHQLGPDDVIKLLVYNEPDLSGSYQVSRDGNLSLPLIGRVLATGKNLDELNQQLTSLYKKYIFSPHISISIKEYHSKKIYVLGQVKNPGTFPFEQGMNIIQAITLAGGFTPIASRRKINISRTHHQNIEKITVSIKAITDGNETNINLLPGDIVYVNESVF